MDNKALLEDTTIAGEKGGDTQRNRKNPTKNERKDQMDEERNYCIKNENIQNSKHIERSANIHLLMHNLP